MKVKAFIERGDDGSYGVYVDLEDKILNYGIIGEGNSCREAIEDFYQAYHEMKELYIKEKKHFIEAEFEFRFDVASFLSYYSNILSLAGLGRLTGIAQGQLSHYITGRRKPSPRTVEKIENPYINSPMRFLRSIWFKREKEKMGTWEDELLSFVCLCLVLK